MLARNPDRPFSAWLIERIPQTVRLRSGLRVHLRNHADAVVFWNVFTSGEYLALVRDLADLDVEVVVDCGAGIGMFSLLVEHLCRVGLLDWEDVEVEAIEPAQYNLPQLRKNLDRNLADGRYTIHEGVVGGGEGSVVFYETPKYPWSGSLVERKEMEGRAVEAPVVDLPSIVAGRPAVLKLDVEGAEFEVFEAHASSLGSVEAVVVEWHVEMGDVERGGGLLREGGFDFVRRSKSDGNRLVDLYRRA